MTLPVPSFHQLKDPIIGKDGKPTVSFKKVLQEWQTKLNQTITLLGEINSKIPIQGRTEGIGTTVQHVDSTGNLSSLANVNNTNTDLLTDGTGTPLTGGKRGAIALDTNSRLVDSFRNIPMDVSNTPTSSTTLSNNGVATAIPIASSSNQFSPSAVSYNSGSVDPGVFGGPNFVVASDPTFAGGAVIYSTSTVPQTQTAAKGNIQLGSITTVNGAAKTGGGNTGGTGGRAGGRGYVQS